MKWCEIYEHHDLIRETVGYDLIKKVALEDIPGVMDFLKIVRNYTEMKKVLNEEGSNHGVEHPLRK